MLSDVHLLTVPVPVAHTVFIGRKIKRYIYSNYFDESSPFLSIFDQFRFIPERNILERIIFAVHYFLSTTSLILLTLLLIICLKLHKRGCMLIIRKTLQRRMFDSWSLIERNFNISPKYKFPSFASACTRVGWLSTPFKTWSFCFSGIAFVHVLVNFYRNAQFFFIETPKTIIKDERIDKCGKNTLLKP
jgi:hypothetical protein